MKDIFLSQRLLDAIELTIEAHAKTKRKGDDKPYIIHPIAVFGLLTQWNVDENTRIAGLLHDVIEDATDDQQRIAYRKYIEGHFGKTVLAIVEGVTEQDKSLPWRTRKEHYLKHLQHAPDSSLLVTCADHTHNTFAMLQGYQQQGENFWKRFNASKELKLWYLDEVFSILKKRLDSKYVSNLQELSHDLHSALTTTKVSNSDA